MKVCYRLMPFLRNRRPRTGLGKAVRLRPRSGARPASSGGHASVVPTPCLGAILSVWRNCILGLPRGEKSTQGRTRCPTRLPGLRDSVEAVLLLEPVFQDLQLVSLV